MKNGLTEEMTRGVLALNKRTGKRIGVNRWNTQGASIDGGNSQRYQLVELADDGKTVAYSHVCNYAEMMHALAPRT